MSGKEDAHLEIQVKDSDKIVEIWLSNAEKEDVALRDSLKPMYIDYNMKKYKIAVFESGTGDLFDTTAGLLLHNRMK